MLHRSFGRRIARQLLLAALILPVAACGPLTVPDPPSASPTPEPARSETPAPEPSSESSITLESPATATASATPTVPDTTESAVAATPTPAPSVSTPESTAPSTETAEPTATPTPQTTETPVPEPTESTPESTATAPNDLPIMTDPPTPVPTIAPSAPTTEPTTAAPTPEPTPTHSTATTKHWLDQLREMIDAQAPPDDETTRPGTAETPVPMGNLALFDGTGTLFDRYRAALSVHRVLRGEEAADLIRETSALNPAAPSGYEYLIAEIDVAVTDMLGHDRADISSYSFTLVDPDGDPYASPLLIRSPEPTFTAFTEIGTQRAYVPFYVDPEDPAPRLVFLARNFGGLWMELTDADGTGLPDTEPMPEPTPIPDGTPPADTDTPPSTESTDATEPSDPPSTPAP